MGESMSPDIGVTFFIEKIRIQPPGAVRADAVGKPGKGMLGDVFSHLFPLVFRVPDLFTIGANRDKFLQQPDPRRSIIFKGKYNQ
jgi:hypothetical protein